jgi:hypothetical protein
VVVSALRTGGGSGHTKNRAPSCLDSLCRVAPHSNSSQAKLLHYQSSTPHPSDWKLNDGQVESTICFRPLVEAHEKGDAGSVDASLGEREGVAGAVDGSGGGRLDRVGRRARSTTVTARVGARTTTGVGGGRRRGCARGRPLGSGEETEEKRIIIFHLLVTVVGNFLPTPCLVSYCLVLE